MPDKKLSTEPYKGVRDFYPKEAAIQQYIFDTWSKTAESFGFERYNSSVLEPADLYKAKGAENEELVNEQTYTFTDRGDREVTLRPEMTPSVARMVAAKAREMSFPVRWYSTPNLFRYERPQRGRLREHWQLNCDIFGSSHIAADIEIIALAYQTLIDFGATPDMFEIRINDRALMQRMYYAIGLSEEMIQSLTKLNDRKDKISKEDYLQALDNITIDNTLSEEVIMLLEKSDEQTDVLVGLSELGIENVVFDKYLARGFDYYTGTIFEIVDTHQDNKKTIIGGGRYDNLTAMFGGEPVTGVGFGLGDVRLLNFLEVNKLVPEDVKSTASKVIVLPVSEDLNIEAEKVAMQIRQPGVSVATDISTKKIGDKISRSSERGYKFAMIVGEDEVSSKKFTLKNLESNTESSGTIPELINKIA